jgi:hypothetical protein
MFRALLIVVALFGIYRFVWGIRQGYMGRQIEHPSPRPSRRKREP